MTRLIKLTLAAALLLGAAPQPRAETRVEEPAQGRLLIAKRHLSGPVFGRSVVLLVRHDHTGSLGVILNHPTTVELVEALPELAGLGDGLKLFFGGPVGVEYMVFLARGQRLPDTSHVLEDVYFGGRTDSLKSALTGRDDARGIRVFGGVSGWAPGQLAAELKRGDWFVVEARADFMFDTEPKRLWERLIARLQPPHNLVRRPALTPGRAAL